MQNVPECKKLQQAPLISWCVPPRCGGVPSAEVLSVRQSTSAHTGSGARVYCDTSARTLQYNRASERTRNWSRREMKWSRCEMRTAPNVHQRECWRTRTGWQTSTARTDSRRSQLHIVRIGLDSQVHSLRNDVTSMPSGPPRALCDPFAAFSYPSGET